ncbi:MAG: cytochrome c3 family protein [Nitrospiraceae bacterium]|nr:cytochrome c3 family protein [Nitrospiraceae bacterium]
MSHTWKPVFVVLAILAAIFIARTIIVPPKFGIWESGYMYGWHNKANEQFWLNYKAKYKGRDYCNGCHPDKYSAIMNSPHAIIQCEDCHGPAIDHPDNPPKLAIDKSRALCLRCHVKLPYPTSHRNDLPGFLNPDEHNPGIECVSCHNPHSPVLGGMR